jgi:hypothetical protein
MRDVEFPSARHPAEFALEERAVRLRERRGEVRGDLRVLAQCENFLAQAFVLHGVVAV